MDLENEYYCHSFMLRKLWDMYSHKSASKEDSSEPRDVTPTVKEIEGLNENR